MAEHINQLEQQSCYYLKNICVRSYCHDKSLTMSTKSSIELLSDELMDDIFCEQDVEVLGTKIVGTQSFCSHYSCVNCSGKLEEVTLDTGKCGTCKTLQLLENCAREVTCKILFKTVPPCSHTHSPYCLILQPNLPQCLSCCLKCFGWS